MINEVIIPDYNKQAHRLYDLIINYDIGLLIGQKEILHTLEQAQRVGETIGYNKGFEDCRQKMTKDYL